MLRVGLLGIGDAGAHHARALAAAGEIEWTAIGARDVTSARARATAVGAPAAVKIVSIDDLFGLCDAVIIATPDGLHREHAARALAAGLHVLVEKPLALTAGDAIALVDAATRARRALQVGYHLRHHAGHELIHAQLAALVGEIRTIHVRWAWPDPAVDGWRAKGNGATWWALAALGTHAIDLALWWTGANVVEVEDMLEPPSGIDRAAEVLLRFDTGVLAHVSVAVTHRAQPLVTIAGTAGELEANGTLGASGGGTITHRAGKTTRQLDFAPADPYRRQLDAFVARCANPSIDDHAVANVELLQRITSR